MSRDFFFFNFFFSFFSFLISLDVAFPPLECKVRESNVQLCVFSAVPAELRSAPDTKYSICIESIHFVGLPKYLGEGENY